MWRLQAAAVNLNSGEFQNQWVAGQLLEPQRCPLGHALLPFVHVQHCKVLERYRLPLTGLQYGNMQC